MSNRLVRALVGLLVLLLHGTAGATAWVSRDASTPVGVRNTAALSEIITGPACLNDPNTILIVTAQWGGASCTWGTTPTGFTIVPNSSQQVSGNCFIAYYEFPNSALAQSVTISNTVSAANSEQAFCYGGVSTVTPFDSTNMVAPNNSTGTTITASSVTPTIVTDALVAVFQESSATNTLSALTNATTTMSLWKATANSSTAVADQVNLTSTGASGASTMTGASVANTGFHMLLKAASAVTPTPTATPTPVGVIGSASSSSSVALMSLGSVSGVGSTACVGAVTGASCFSATETCPAPGGGNLTNITVNWALNNAAVSPKGVVVLVPGAPLGSYFGTNSNQPFAGQYVTDSYWTVQLAWPAQNPFFDSGTPAAGALWTSCRIATMLKYVYDNYTSGQTIPMVAQAHSAGSSALWYSIIDYGINAVGSGGAKLKAIMVTASSPIVQHFLACTTNTAPTWSDVAKVTSSSHDCAGKVDAGIGFVNTTQTCVNSVLIDSADNTCTCSGTASSWPIGDQNQWKSNSLNSLGKGSYANLPAIAWFNCLGTNQASPNGFNLAKTLGGLINYMGCNSPSDVTDSCTGETYWDNGAGIMTTEFNEMYQKLEACATTGC